MFCPTCGVREDRPVQFCRSCGGDLRAVRMSLDQPDLVTASAVAAREEIGRAVALMIKETEQLKEIEDVLPAVEKFLETPQERRLRRLRGGVVTSSVGIGVAFFFFLLSLADHGAFFLVGMGGIVFMIGLGIIFNALVFTLPKQDRLDRATDEQQPEIMHRLSSDAAGTNRTLNSAPQPEQAPSVTEHTTKHLPNEMLK